MNNTRATMAAVHFNWPHSVIAEKGSWNDCAGFVGSTWIDGRYVSIPDVKACDQTVNAVLRQIERY